MCVYLCWYIRYPCFCSWSFTVCICMCMCLCVDSVGLVLFLILTGVDDQYDSTCLRSDISNLRNLLTSNSEFSFGGRPLMQPAQKCRSVKSLHCSWDTFENVLNSTVSKLIHAKNGNDRWSFPTRFRFCGPKYDSDIRPPDICWPILHVAAVGIRVAYEDVLLRHRNKFAHWLFCNNVSVMHYFHAGAYIPQGSVWIRMNIAKKVSLNCTQILSQIGLIWFCQRLQWREVFCWTWPK